MSIFDTTANTGFNSFGNPMNSANLNGPGWGMDPNYLTPSFDAPYRPPYSGGTHIAQQNPGFFRAAYGIAFDPTNPQYGVGSNAFDSNNFDAMGNRPMDAGAAFGQRFATPLASFAGAFAVSRAWQTRNMSRGAYDWSRLFGAGRSEAMRVSGFTAMGQRFGAGAAQGLVGGASMFANISRTGAFARTATYGAAAIGGAVASVALPAAIAQGAIGAADSMIFDNYTGIRESSNMFRSANRGITFGGGHGDPYTGQGISRRQSARMGTDMTDFAAKDQLFNPREMASIGSMASQMGMMDNVGAGQITNKLKSIVQQLKVVMSVAGTTDFKEAMAMMARLQMAGVSSGNLGSTVAGIGSFASQAGISTSRMMSTVGAQGQYLFQSNGLTPYLGQITAANSMAGFASAFRTGLISQEQMARMGGVEGATQSSMTGQLNASQTTYNMMRGFNKYTSGAGGGGVIENVTNFGRAFAGNPLEAYGALVRTGKGNVSKLMRDEGALSAYNQMKELAQINPLTANRKLSQDHMAALFKQMGMSDDEVVAHLAELGSYQDPASQRQRVAGARSAEINMNRDYLEQTEQTRFKSWAPVRGAVGAYRGAKGAMAQGIGSILGATGGFTDSMSNWWTSTTVGSPEALTGTRMSQDSTGSLEMPKTSGMNNRMVGFQGDIEKMKSLARSGDQLAKKALAGDHDSIFMLAKNGQIDAKYARTGDINVLASVMSNLPKEVDSSSGAFNGMEKALQDSDLFSGSTIDKAKGFRLAYQIQKKMEENANFLSTDEGRDMRDRWSKLTGQTSLADIDAGTSKAVGYASDKGISVYADYDSAQEGEGLRDFAKRTDMTLEKATRYTNSNTSNSQKLQHLKQVETLRRQDEMRRNVVNSLSGEQRINVEAAYKMQDAGDALKEAAADLKQAAGTLKEVKVQGGSDSSWGIFGGPSSVELLMQGSKIKGRK